MGFAEKFNSFTQGAVSKSKEVAEIAKLNLANGNLESEIKTVTAQIGEYVVANHLLADDELIGQKLSQIDEILANIADNKKKIMSLKNIQVCPACGAEVPATSNFCTKCGTAMPKEEAPVAEETPVVTKVCVNCGTALEADATFCANCGTKCE